MKVVNIEIIPFRYHSDRYQNGQALPKREIIQTLTRIVTDDGAEGYYFGGQGHGDQDGLAPATRAFLETRIKSMLVGQDPFDRERFWQWMYAAKTPENIMGVVDMALWDLAGRVAGLPVSTSSLEAVGTRSRPTPVPIPTWVHPENYAEHALACKRQGYRAYKIHPYYYWNPDTKQAVPGRPSHVEWDIAACRAVREAVGDDMVLMYDPWGTYHIYEEALRVGRELEKLNFYWYEHPMPEHRVDTYIRLARELEHSYLLTRDPRRRSLYSRGLDSPRCFGHQSDRRVAWRHYRREEDGDRVRSVWGSLRDPHERNRQSARPRLDQRGYLRVLRARFARAGRRLRRATSVPERTAGRPRCRGLRPRSARPGPGLPDRLGLHRRDTGPPSKGGQMPQGQPMRGVYPILVTPFDERGRIDEESLRRLIDFNLDAGVHGLGIAMASEVLKLTDPERRSSDAGRRRPGAGTRAGRGEHRRTGDRRRGLLQPARPGTWRGRLDVPAADA